jgi:hypothetical protein
MKIFYYSEKLIPILSAFFITGLVFLLKIPHIIFLWESFLLIYTSFILLRKIKIYSEISIPDKILSVISITLTIIIIFEIFLGSINMLNFNNIVFLTLLLFLIISIREDMPGPVVLLNSSKELIKQFKKFMISLSFLQKLLILILLIAYTFQFIIGIIFPPREWDSIWYHLPIPVFWLQNHNTMPPELPEDERASVYYPKNSELLLFYLISPFYDSILTGPIQMFFGMIAALSIYSISKKIDLGEKSSAWASILFLSIPMIFFQSAIQYNDLILASLFLLTLNFILFYLRSKEKAILLISALISGVLLGTKYNAIPIFLYFLIFLICMKIKSKHFLLYVLVSILVGSYWYVINIINTNNPIYPITIGFGDSKEIQSKEKISIYTLFLKNIDYSIEKHYVNKTIEFIIYPLKEIIYIKNYGYSIGLGYFFYFLLVTNLYSLIDSLLKKNKISFFILLFLPIMLIFFFYTPPRELRYYLSPLGILCISFSYFLTIHKNNGNSQKFSKLIEVIIFILILLTFNHIREYFFSNFQILMEMATKVDKYEKYRIIFPEYGEGWEWLNKNTNNANITFITPFIYPLFGEKYKNKLISIPGISFSTVGNRNIYINEKEFVELKERNINFLLATFHYWDGIHGPNISFSQTLNENVSLVYFNDFLRIYKFNY